MKKLLLVIAHELKGAIVPIAYFFVMFHLIAFTNSLLLESYRITPGRAVLATIGALVAGKAILVANKVPFLNIFSARPLVFSIAWRSLVYGVFFALFFASEQAITALMSGGGIDSALEKARQISLRHTAANCIWLCLSMVLYNSFAELDRLLGKGTLPKAFLGLRASPAAPAASLRS